MNAPNAQYNVAAPDSLPIRIAGMQRRKMYQEFLRLQISPRDTILDIGVTSDRSYDHSNYLEAWYPFKDRITAVGIDDGAVFLEGAYPGIKFLKADGRALPFPNAAFDYVHSSAVLEHVGSTTQQSAFIAEACRVARKGVLITTPNRWFPVEFHTVLPLVHWLPKKMFRRLLVALGKPFFSREENLNLVTSGELRAMVRSLDGAKCHVRGVRLAGLVSNLLLVAEIPSRPR